MKLESAVYAKHQSVTFQSKTVRARLVMNEYHHYTIYHASGISVTTTLHLRDTKKKIMSFFTKVVFDM